MPRVSPGQPDGDLGLGHRRGGGGRRGAGGGGGGG